jgi:hypothetical protein
MDFYIKISKKVDFNFDQKFVNDLYGTNIIPNVLYIEKLEHLDYQTVDDEDRRIWQFGDVIHSDFQDAIKEKGIFYTLKHDSLKKILYFNSDFHSFLPIYYSEQEDNLIISSSVDLIARNLKYRTPNAQFLTDIALLNIPFGDECFFNEINRLAYGSSIKYSSSGISITQRKRVFHEFASQPSKYNRAIAETVDLFINNCRAYFDQPTNISLTGGFDGRTATAIAHYYQNDFKTYSYGKKENDDVYIPTMLSEKLHFPYRRIELGGNYIENDYKKFSREYLKFSGGMNGFLYPHVPFGAYLLSADKRPIITGYCGSELLRNAHFGGAVSSSAVINILDRGIDHSFASVNNLKDYSILGEEYLTPSLIQSSITKADSFLDKLPKELSKNQKLVVFEFEETYPKLFGLWVYVGMHYARMRIPFFDPEFYSYILKTQVSQVYRNFMEQNPFKRFYGQLFYSKVIDQTWPEIGLLMSGKSYAPNDLLSLKGKLRVAYGYLGKKKRNSKIDFDNLGLISGIKQYISTSKNLELKSFIADDLLNELHHNELKRDMLLLRLSALEYKNDLKQTD